MSFRPGDVVDAFFPFRDREGGKHRYMVVLSTVAHQERAGSLTGVGVFTTPRRASMRRTRLRPSRAESTAGSMRRS